MNTELNFGIKKTRLEAFKFVLEQRIDKHLLLNSNIEVFEDMCGAITDNINVSLRGYVYGEKLKPVKISYPLNWKESFKERWFPKWLLKRFPVKLKVHDVSFSCVYPNFAPSITCDYGIQQYVEVYDTTNITTYNKNGF